MKLLLDTHTLLWMFMEPDKLSPAAKAAMATPETSLNVSVASLWEITIKIAKGQLSVPGNSVQYVMKLVDGARIPTIRIRPTHLLELQALPYYHKDPFDRMLIAQSRAERMPLVTVDRDIQRYELQTLW